MPYFLLLAACLAIAGIGWAIREKQALAAKIMMGAGALGCVALIAWQTRGTFASGTPQLEDSYLASVSFVLAQEVAREMGSRGGNVVLVYPPSKQLDAKTADSLTYVFARVLRDAPALRIRHETLSPKRASGPLSAADFETALTGAAGDVAYVSFAGVASGIEALACFQQQNPPRLFAFDPSGASEWLPGMKKGVIRRVVVVRPEAREAPPAEAQGRPDQVFRSFFILVGPENADQVAGQMGGK